jgi:hypothetical protein
MSATRRTVLLSLVLLVLAVGAGGCGSGYDGENYVPSGGVDAGNRGIRLDDVWIDGPNGVAAGATTGLRLYLANDSFHRDALTGVTVSIARRSRLMLNGRPVRRIPVGAWSARDLEWRSHRDGVELSGLRRAVRPGQWFFATFRFLHSRPVTVQVTVAPLAPEVRADSRGGSNLGTCASWSSRTTPPWPTCSGAP